jgi:hypothetical protein
MKGPLVAALVVILLVGAGGAYLLLHSASTSSTSSTGTNQSTSSTSSLTQTQNAPAHITLSFVTCTSDAGTCVITLVNSGGTAVGATGCTLNGVTGVFVPSSIPPGGIVNVSCAPPKGTAIPIPGFHVEGFVQLGDGSSVQYTGSWQ